VLHGALASTAGTLFEAAPFVLASAFLPSRWAAGMAFVGSCGCGRRYGPAALSLPATVLCAILFGPPVAAARFLIAALLALWWMRRPNTMTAGNSRPDPLADLGAIVAPAFAIGTATALAQSGELHLALASLALAWFEVLGGLALGVVAPCATATIALAGSLRQAAPLAAYAMLAGTGMLPALRRSANTEPRDARLGFVLCGAALAAVACRGGAGFVHPRLIGFVAIGAGLAAWCAIGTRWSRAGIAVPSLMVVALFAGSPPPASALATVSSDTLYAGETIARAGEVRFSDGRPTLVRSIITCCRADATVTSLPLDRALAPGWVALRGVIELKATGLRVRVTSWRPIRPPADPYEYR